MGVRVPPDPFPDIQLQADGTVIPGGGGMSVAPHDPRNLAPHRRPAEFGGVGHDPVWEYSMDRGLGSVEYSSDSDHHGVIEPNARMDLRVYEKALEDTKDGWVKQCPN